jgi:hypothetical protein
VGGKQHAQPCKAREFGGQGTELVAGQVQQLQGIGQGEQGRRDGRQTLVAEFTSRAPASAPLSN